MAENSKLTGIEVNGVLYSLGKNIYEELGISLVRFAELLGRDFYCPTLDAAPTTSTITYTDTDGEEQTFQIGQPCRWQENGKWRLALLEDNTSDVASWYILPTEFLSAEVLETKQDKALKFTDLLADTWVSDTAYSDFPYRCDVACEGVTGDMYADVVFSLEQSVSGLYAPVCETRTNAVSVWSSENTTITIPTILITV